MVYLSTVHKCKVAMYFIDFINLPNTNLVPRFITKSKYDVISHTHTITWSWKISQFDATWKY